MSPTATSFYQTGGTLTLDAPSYVERQADTDLFDGLMRGEFCYVLTSRQMGKSSLMVRTATRLRQEGVAVAVLDLTALGQNLSVEQWYEGLLGRVGRQLNLEDELDEYWLMHERQSPLQRWMGALHEIVLARCSGRLVIFIDEIDAVRSLPFSTDEFFAAIRECYNRRPEEPAFERMTFCLLGVAAPTDLIRNPRMTPFNVGRRIELTDFTEAEAAPLAAGLNHERHEEEKERHSLTSSPPHPITSSLLRRVLYWTGGQPYLTQRLCQAVGEAVAGEHGLPASVLRPRLVDRLCGELFLSQSAREKDTNLLFVRERILHSDAEPAALLDVYAKVLRRREPVRDDAANPLAGILRLAGIVRGVGGVLQVRNRIYGRVFDRKWVVENMPGAELRRQRLAYWRGVLRTAAIATAIVAVIGSLAVIAVLQARRAEEQRRIAEAGRQMLRRHLYAAQMNLAQQDWSNAFLEQAQRLLDGQRPQPGQEDLRGFDWRYLWRLCQGDQRATLHTPYGSTAHWFALAALSPDGRLLALGNDDDSIRLWSIGSRRTVATLKGRAARAQPIAFSPDGKILAVGESDQTVRLWDIASRREIARFPGSGVGVAFRYAALSPDDRTVAIGTKSGLIHLWDVASRRKVATLKGHRRQINALVFSPDGKSLASASEESAARLWDVAAHREGRRGAPRWSGIALPGQQIRVLAVAFSPDGKRLATGGADNTVKLWDVATRRELATFSGHTDVLTSLGFSPDGQTLASGSADNTIRLWNVATPQPAATLRGHKSWVWSLAFAPDGKTLVSSSTDNTVRLWDAHPAPRVPILGAHADFVASVAFSPDGRTLSSGSHDRSVKLWDVRTRRQIATLIGHTDEITDVAFSPDGRTLASESQRAVVKLWDVASRQAVFTFKGPTGASDEWHHGLAFSPDGRTLASGSADKTVKLWNLATNQVRATLKGHDRPVTSLAFSPDGKLLASGRDDESIRLWDVATGQERREHAPTGFGSALAFSPDGRTLAAASWDKTARLWDLRSGRELATLKGHREGIFRLAFSPDGTTLATGSGDNSIKLWNLASFQEVASLREHRDGVISVAFSPDGLLLATGSLDKTVRLWPAASFQETDPLQAVALAGDHAVTLQWRPLSWALGYNVYRGSGVQAFGRSGVQEASSSTRERLIRLTSRPVTGTLYADQSPGLVNGRPLTYWVRPVFREAGGKIGEAPPSILRATPMPAPPGFTGSSINEGARIGSVLFEPAIRQITLRGAGLQLYGEADSLYFVHRPVTGDFQVTVRLLAGPTRSGATAKAGLMIRESLDPDARCATLFATSDRDLRFQWRAAANESTDMRSRFDHGRLKLPILLRLTRQGDTIRAEYSRDEGKSLHLVPQPWRFDPPLPETLSVGLAIASENEDQTSEAKFSGLEIQNR